MDDLKHELEEIKKTKDFEKQRSDLDAFHGKLSRLQFFDPACGSGNFRFARRLDSKALFGCKSIVSIFFTHSVTPFRHESDGQFLQSSSYRLPFPFGADTRLY